METKKMINKRVKHTTDSISQLAKHKGWEFLSSKYTVGGLKYKFICNKGHKIKKTGENFLRGAKCKECSDKPTITIDVLRMECKNNEWELRTKSYSGKAQMLKIMCQECKTEFPLNSKYLRGKKRRKHCPNCDPTREKNIEEIKNMSKQIGIKCNSEKYTGMMGKHEFECPDNHIWFARPNDIFNKQSRCPECRLYRNEEKIKFIFENYFKQSFLKKSKIKTGSGQRIELDGVNNDLDLAFEYNGIQHYEYTPHYHRKGEKDLIAQQERDTLTIKYCNDHKIDLIVIPYTLDNNDNDLANFILKNIPNRFENDHPRILKIIKSFGIHSAMLDPIRIKLKSLGLEILSNVYTTANARNIYVKCQKCQHEYDTSKNKIDRGDRCPNCRPNKTFTYEDILKIGNHNDLIVISTIYTPGNPICWKCKKCNHNWEARPTTIKGTKNKKGTNCPKCFGKTTTTLEKVKELAKLRGHECLSERIKNRESILKFRCSKKKGEIHEWETTYISYQRSKNGCRICTGKQKHNSK